MTFSFVRTVFYQCIVFEPNVPSFNRTKFTEQNGQWRRRHNFYEFKTIRCLLPNRSLYYQNTETFFQREFSIQTKIPRGRFTINFFTILFLCITFLSSIFAKCEINFFSQTFYKFAKTKILFLFETVSVSEIVFPSLSQQWMWKKL